jgi:hypothetical protein
MFPGIGLGVWELEVDDSVGGLIWWFTGAMKMKEIETWRPNM